MNLLPFLPTLLILIYIPMVCISDIRTRTFNVYGWIPLAAVGICFLVTYLLESPTRNFYLLGLSAILCLALLVVSIIGGIGGADVIFASFIMLFVQYNPFTFPREFFALDFFWTLMLVTICLPIIIWVYNFKEGNLRGDELVGKTPYTFIEMLTKFPRGIPFMLPISFAFVVTLVMEVLL